MIIYRQGAFSQPKCFSERPVKMNKEIKKKKIYRHYYYNIQDKIDKR